MLPPQRALLKARLLHSDLGPQGRPGLLAPRLPETPAVTPLPCSVAKCRWTHILRPVRAAGSCVLRAFVPERGFYSKDHENHYQRQALTESLGCVRTESGFLGLPSF